MVSSQAQRVVASVSSGMVTARGREPAEAVDEQYHVNSATARVLYCVNSITRPNEQCHVNSTVSVARVTIAQEQYCG
jgi:hypothetical protein